MEVMINSSDFENIAVRYSEDEVKAALLAIRFYREWVLEDDTSYDDIEKLQSAMAVLFTIEDQLEMGDLIAPDVDEALRTIVLPHFVDFVRGIERHNRAKECSRLRVTAEELYCGAADVIIMLDEERMPDITIVPDYTPPDGPGGVLALV